ncbi:hypothetical protein SmaMPs15_000040 [Stenotrophomonas maltophilia phage vB_SmaM_Ps15]|uniref:Uncharacterized protein n=1 Tax=Stenotrophomonas maltophilia phage vB_SmaM_Ps15 TaxID=3071007 RepID=A0AAE9JV74_9CAUD|nr:hypothetical protein PQC01_gp040 [Stenotrophomonas maltophilia phage vB_SmaM_Ps15]UMO77191.1 hypothetical protein SmaMPs15_000040 [Stenotrophomonas maltophilia phage vB_SmaM_Ps15]
MMKLHLSNAEIDSLPFDIQHMINSSEEIFPDGAVYRVFLVSFALWNATHNALEEIDMRENH